jgi:large subunit ribosomal protein L23
MKKVIIKPLVSEKALQEYKDNKYVIYVDPDCNKIEIKKYLEELYKVTVLKINISNIKGKKRRRGRITGFTKKRKKAIITLPAGQEFAELKRIF